jgi:hypothetical protein
MAMRSRSIARWAVLAAAGVLLALAAGCDTYGTRLPFNGGELYYTSDVSKDQAERLGNYLIKKGVFDGQRKTVQLTTRREKDREVFVVRLVIRKDYQKEENLRLDVKKLCGDISREVFDGAWVEGQISDDRLNPVGDPLRPWEAEEKKGEDKKT